MPNRFFAEFAGELSGNGLKGYAHVFGHFAQMPKQRHLETMGPQAFTRSRGAGHDVVATIEHDPKRLLGSTRSKSLIVEADDKGLAFEIPELPDTSYVRDMRVLIERGDLAFCSFGFVPGEEEWSRTPDGRQLRTHTSVERLFDVSVVSLPAFEGTGAQLRAMTFEPRNTDLRTQLLRLELKALEG